MTLELILIPGGSVLLQLLFFYGASKGNPGVSGVGGLVYSSGKLIKTSFSWGLGFMMNNQAESYGLLKSCQNAKELSHKSIQIFGDSDLLIKSLNSASQLGNTYLNNILLRVRNLLKDFESVQPFHFLREFNSSADELGNKACQLGQVHLSINGKTNSYCSIP